MIQPVFEELTREVLELAYKIADERNDEDLGVLGVLTAMGVAGALSILIAGKARSN
jgi:hypothetical protein